MVLFGLASVVLAGCTENVSVVSVWRLQMTMAMCAKVDGIAYLLVVLSCT